MTKLVLKNNPLLSCCSVIVFHFSLSPCISCSSLSPSLSLSISQVQATVVGLLAAVGAVALGAVGRGSVQLGHAAVLCASSVSTAFIAALCLGKTHTHPHAHTSSTDTTKCHHTDIQTQHTHTHTSTLMHTHLETDMGVQEVQTRDRPIWVFQWPMPMPIFREQVGRWPIYKADIMLVAVVV